MAPKSFTKLIFSLLFTAALYCGAGNVLADENRVEALETRVAELEALVQQLLSAQQQARAPGSVGAEVRAEPVAKDKGAELMAQHHSGEEKIDGKHSFKLGGYVKADLIYSDFSGGSVPGNNAGRDFYIPGTVPIGESAESYLDLHAKESRINLQTRHLLDNGANLEAFLEVDFLLSGQGDERVSNSSSPRLRQAFLTYNNWLFGQTWMTFQNVSALPENLDFVGPSESTIFGRQAMIRYSNGPWQISLENPETTITPFGGGDRIIADDNRVPDMVARYNLNRDWGNFTVAVLARELRYEDAAAGIDDSTGSYGLSLSGKIRFGERDDFRWMASTGRGLGRYIGLNTANGAVLDGDGRLHAIDSTGIFGSYRHFWNKKWRSNLTLGYLSVDNDIELTGEAETSEAMSLHLNLMYSPQPRLDFGIEFLYANREEESGVDGDLNRFQFSAKYAY